MKKLRNYKGVVYDPFIRYAFLYAGDWYASAAKIITTFPQFTDADHAELMALKANPYAPTPTLRGVVEEWVSSTQFASVRVSDIESLCARLREAFPDIDEEGV